MKEIKHHGAMQKLHAIIWSVANPSNTSDKTLCRRLGFN